MNKPLMPKATAVWLIENTTLTFLQIAEFCGLHPLEIQGIADGEVSKGIVGLDPVTSGQLTRDEIARCESDAKAKMKLAEEAMKHNIIEKKQKKSAKYTPVARRQDKPDAIAWIVKNCPDIADSQLVKLIGTTKTTIDAVRSKTHWNSAAIKPRDPVLLGLCSQIELDKAFEQVQKKLEMKKKSEVSIDLEARLAGVEDIESEDSAQHNEAEKQ